MKKISKVLFFLSYFIYLFFNILNASFYSIYVNSYMKLIMVFCVLLLILKEFLYNKIIKKEAFFMLLCGFLFAILLLHVNGFAMFPLFFFIYGARDIEFKKITKFTAILCSIFLIFIIISAYFGIITNYVDITRERTRFYLGFRYALFPQMLLFNITACSMYVNKDKFSIIRCIFWILINYWLFSYTDSRLSFYLAILLIFIISFVQFNPNFFDNKKVISYILIFSFPICAISSIYITSIYDSSNVNMRNLNEFLGGRLYLGKNSFYQYNINLFGHKTEYIGNGLDMNGRRDMIEHNYVDCLYINMLEKYGIIFSVIFLSLLTYSLYSAWKEKNYILFVILVMFAFHGVIDDLEIYLYYNAFWLAVSNYFKKDKKIKIKGE